jgi:hypothetical protein
MKKNFIKRRPNINKLQMKTIMKEAEYKQSKSHNLYSSSSATTDFMSAPKAAPQPKTSATAIALSQLVLRRRRYRLPDHVLSFRRFKLWQGAKWTIGKTCFFGSCDNSPCRHRNSARTNLKKFMPRRINQHTRCQGEALGQPWGPQFQA